MGAETYQLPERLKGLKDAYLRAVPSISIGRAIAVTEVFKQDSDLPINVLRAKAFRHACE